MHSRESHPETAAEQSHSYLTSLSMVQERVHYRKVGGGIKTLTKNKNVAISAIESYSIQFERQLKSYPDQMYSIMLTDLRVPRNMQYANICISQIETGSCCVPSLH